MKLLRQVPVVLNQMRLSSSLIGNEREVTFTTCRDFYASKAKSILYRNGSSAGITVNMKYLDTGSRANTDSPTVLAIHGSPGSYRDFADLIIGLKMKGFRVIVPNLPDMKLTDRTVTFYHSTEEKSELLRDFMTTIQVPSVDCAVVHSAGVFSAMKVWHDRAIDVKSLLLINPSGHRTIRAMKPEWLIHSLLRLNLTPPGRWLYGQFGHLIAQAAKVKVDASKEASDDAVLGCLTIYMAGITRLVKYYQELAQRRTPTSFFYSDRDRLIDHEIFLEMIAYMGGSEENISVVSQGDILRAAEKNLHWLRIFNMKNAGHFAYKQNTNLLEDEVCRLVAAVRPSVREKSERVQEKNVLQQRDLHDEIYTNSGNRRAYVLNMQAPTLEY